MVRLVLPRSGARDAAASRSRRIAADGVVNMITEAVPPPELGLGDEALPRISVFMNVFNCHVNRMPVSGKVVKSLYRTGSF